LHLSLSHLRQQKQLGTIDTENRQVVSTLVVVPEDLNEEHHNFQTFKFQINDSQSTYDIQLWLVYKQPNKNFRAGKTYMINVLNV
jgi:hypothetical protein